MEKDQKFILVGMFFLSCMQKKKLLKHYSFKQILLVFLWAFKMKKNPVLGGDAKWKI